MAKKYLIFGRGYVASHIQSAIEASGGWCRLERFNPILCKDHIKSCKPDWVVNATGFCGINNIDDCELMKEETFYANLSIPVLIARECEEFGIPLLHVSSACLWKTEADYTLGRRTIDTTYAISKAAAEHALTGIGTTDKRIIARIRMPFDNVDGRRNTLSKLISYPEIWRTNHFSMSHMPTAAAQMVSDMNCERYGIRSYTCPGTIDNVRISSLIEKQFGIAKKISLPTIVALSKRSFIEVPPTIPSGSTVSEQISNCLRDWRWR